MRYYVQQMLTVVVHDHTSRDGMILFTVNRIDHRQECNEHISFTMFELHGFKQSSRDCPSFWLPRQ